MIPNRSHWAAVHFRNKQGGLRLAVGVAGGVTSEHANVQLVDDPLKPLEVTGKLAVSKAALAKCDTWWDQTMPTRLVDVASGGCAARVIIMQRLHEGDLSGRMIKDAGYTHLCLPMEYVPKYAPGSFARFPVDDNTPDDEQPRSCVVKGCAAQHRETLAPDDDGHCAPVDPRTEPDELLDPVRAPRATVERLKAELGARAAAAQLEQTPTPAEGAIFKRSMIKFYRKALLPKLDRQIQSWDMTFKATGSSYVCGQAWGQKAADVYLLGQRRDRWGLMDTCNQVRGMTIDFPKAYKKYIEAKANGPAVEDTLKSELSGITMVEPEGGKEARANAVEPMWDSGNVWLPHPEEAPWILIFIEELLGFPAVVNDDQVDCMSQALVKLRRHNLERLRAAMANAQSPGRRSQ
jgi:predicted phage terminase large subunit-like protein